MTYAEVARQGLFCTECDHKEECNLECNLVHTPKEGEDD